MSIISEKSDIDEPKEFTENALNIRKITHKAIKDITDALENLRFNRAIAHIYEFTNEIQNMINKNKKINDISELYAFRELLRDLLPTFCLNGATFSRRMLENNWL